jgi:hypothetical protein
MTTQPRSRSASHPDLSIGLAERLALYVFGVACLISFFLDSPVPMAIAP